MAVTGRTGADAVNIRIIRVMHTLTRYGPKFDAVITAATVAGAITTTEAATIRAFVTGLSALVIALNKLADYSGF